MGVDTKQMKSSQSQKLKIVNLQTQVRRRKATPDFISKKDRLDQLKSDRKLNALTLGYRWQTWENNLQEVQRHRQTLPFTTAPSKWWYNVPIKRTNIIKKVPLRHLGNFQHLWCKYSYNTNCCFRGEPHDAYKEHHKLTPNSQLELSR